ncbi:MAG TPA: hypothetical protein VGV61_14300 [Thermoanaerobaculia bacterium]|jgi:hypothetical protein|nr:hypothetical protein [Thermoanaerobaculia bacterium]
MGRSRIGWLAALALALAAGPAQAVEPHLFSVGILGGIGGPIDADSPDPGLDQRNVELQASLFTEPRTLLVLRVGRLDFESGDRLGDLQAPQLEYATIAGEYRFYRDYYDSGVFIGLGGYRLRGQSTGGGDRDETAPGLTVGVTGEFEVTRWLGVLGEISGHWANLDESQIFATAQAGLVVKF